MSEPRKLPTFASEAEEAEWWFETREQRAAEYLEKQGDAPVRTGRLARRVAESQGFTPISLDSQDISNAKQLAEQSGMEVKNYLAMLIHEALQQKMQNAA